MQKQDTAEDTYFRSWPESSGTGKRHLSPPVFLQWSQLAIQGSMSISWTVQWILAVGVTTYISGEDISVGIHIIRTGRHILRNIPGNLYGNVQEVSGLWKLPVSYSSSWEVSRSYTTEHKIWKASLKFLLIHSSNLTHILIFCGIWGSSLNTKSLWH